MKKILLLLLIPFIGVSQAVNNHVSKVSLPTPDAIALGKFGDIPVDYSTGVPNAPVAIHTIQAGSINLPIGISQHSSGLRPGETASWVGHGWALNAGGMISRTVQGIEDEYDGGFLSQGLNTSVLYSPADTCFYNPFFDQPVYSMITGKLDGEPDIFSYSMAGMSGKFYLNASSSVVKIPENDLKITYTLGSSISDFNRLRQFVITNTDGTKYIFGQKSTGYKAIELSYLNDLYNFKTASTWKLVRIESADGNYYIDFNYTPEVYAYGIRDKNGIFGGSANLFNKMGIDGHRLTSIVSSTGRDFLTFVPAANVREDVFGTISNGTKTAYALDRIEIQNGAFCKKYVFNYQYTVDNTSAATAIDNENKKRLLLNAVQEKSCDNSSSIPAYTFQYDITGNYLPHKLTAGTDHWGNYNGAENNKNFLYNIPYTKLEYFNGSQNIVVIEGGADKKAHSAFSKLGTLTKIIYPTGGNTAFEYEANNVYDTLHNLNFTYLPIQVSKSSCSYVTTDKADSLFTLSDAPNTYFEIKVSETSGVGGFCCNIASSSSLSNQVNFKILQGTTEIWNKQLLIPCGQSTIMKGKLPNFLLSGVPYTFRINAFNATGELKLLLKTESITYQNIETGGIRIKKIKHHDGISTANDIIKDYDYTDPVFLGRSSGVLYNKPLYGFVKSFVTRCQDEDSLNNQFFANHFLFDFSPVPLSTFEGYQLLYKSVKESTPGAGFKRYNYFTVPYQSYDELPYAPPQPGISTGNMESESSYTSTGDIKTFSFNSQKSDAFTYNNTANSIFVKAYWGSNGGGGSPIGLYKIYNIGSKPFRLASVENHKDGLTTTTNLTYRNDKEHLLPIQTQTSHSDGTVEKQTIKYAKELNQTDLLSRHMIGMPLESQNFVNNVLTGGQKTNFSLFSAFPRPQTIQTYNTVLSTWETEATFNSYDAFGNPSSVTLRGWQPETYTWNKDLMTQKNYLAFQWKYEYETNTALLKKYTEPNSLFTTYSYDALSRLSTVNQYSGKAITGLSYAYSPANNTIGISTNYATGADLSTQKIIDGLGRNIKIRKIGYGQGGQDVVSQTDFDPAGRVKKEFLPGFTNPSTAFTEYAYEDSPLGRPIAITRPAPLGVETMGYSIDGDFFVETLTNALGEYTKTYTDTRGRKAGTISGKGSLTNTTYNFYDDRNNLIKVRPDGRGDADADYIYTYTYDGRNRLTSKKIPEKALIQMAYNLRDLPTHTKDGIHPPIYAGYDDYGRNIFSGTVANMSSTAIIDTLAKTDFITNPASLGFGQPFKNKVAVFGANGQPNGQFILSETQIFDSYHRPIYTRSNHILNLANPSAITNTVFYNARDQINSQAEGVAVNGITYSISQSHTYDNGGRKTKTEVSFDNILNKNIEETTAFDALDKPLQTKIGGNLQTIDYQYFAGGFLDKINGGTTGAGGLALTANGWPSENSSNDLFAMDLDYLSNGNISNWKQQNRGFALQNYAYTYDNLQRITNATDGTFHQAYSYKDALGNFNGIFRNDLVKTNGNWALQNIDDNAYFYGIPLSSKISSILDYTGSQLGYKANSGTYAYDANGNTTYDPANKVSTLYNYLNLPSKFTKDDGKKQELVYDFSGRKWQVKEFNNTSSLLSTHSYIGSFEFEGNSLNLVHHGRGFIKNLKSAEYQTGTQNGNMQGSNIVSTQKISEGKYEAENQISLLPGFESKPNTKFSAEIKLQNPQYQWQYALSDHLGNLRVLFTDKNNDGLIRQSLDDNLNEVLSFRNYSPFGLELGGSHKNLDYQNGYKFGGKELNNFTGLTDFGRRNLDAPLGRFTSQDRFSEKYYDLSNMGYASGNPLSYIDYNGDSLIVAVGGVSYSYGFTSSGGYGFYDNSGNIYSGNNKYLNDVSYALARLGLGKEGRKLVDFLSKNTTKIEIQNTTGSNQARFIGISRSIAWSSSNMNGGTDENGSTSRPSFIGLGHEMAHIEDVLNGTVKPGNWIDDKSASITVPNAEIYATHRENQFRVEQGQSLRTDYVPNYSGSRLIDINSRSSLYFDSQGNSYFNSKNNSYKMVPKTASKFKY
jgi:RHS repeat-associated protein